MVRSTAPVDVREGILVTYIAVVVRHWFLTVYAWYSLAAAAVYGAFAPQHCVVKAP